ncbi:hypothetical protein IU469_32350 [Nocardia puris]|uniref:hypothetical protein n=1 Tax=Nocardia puris TaxID=208602 RepID=UPI0018937FCE|nr:hypothetical protein [Nocardia puris]MBF6370359.1 hypothetical protein [Nocardia puris]
MRAIVPALVTGTAAVTALHPVFDLCGLAAVAVCWLPVPEDPVELVAGQPVPVGYDIVVCDRDTDLDAAVEITGAAVGGQWRRSMIVAGHDLLPALDRMFMLRSNVGEDVLTELRGWWVDRALAERPRLIDTAWDLGGRPRTAASPLAVSCGRADLQSMVIGLDPGPEGLERAALTGAVAVALLAATALVGAGYRWSRPGLDLDAIVTAALADPARRTP